MRVVDEETLNEVDLETKASEHQDAAKAVDDLPSKPVDEEDSSPPPLLRPEPEFIGPEEEKEIIPLKPKRKPRAKKELPPVLVPALEKPPEAFKELSKLRKDRLKEQIECPNGCGKMITRHAASYTHNKH